MDESTRTWRGAFDDTGLTLPEFWLSYFALGGNASAGELSHYLAGRLAPSPIEYDVIVHALNERLGDLGRDWPVPYWRSVLD